MGNQADINEDSEIYVCITHQRVVPCDEGDHHLISNWVVDVKKIMRLMEKKNG
jgi:hypothetical protein